MQNNDPVLKFNNLRQNNLSYRATLLKCNWGMLSVQIIQSFLMSRFVSNQRFAEMDQIFRE
jgi:hypothetical protein